MNLENAFRTLRRAWFDAHLRSDAHEREWETEEQERRRNLRNAELLAVFDADTERIIASGAANVRIVCPTCANDIWPDYSVEDGR